MRAMKLKLVLSVILAGAMLAGCGQKDPAKQAAADARDVAMAERMSREPLQPIVPEPITASQITRYGLDRTACSFRRDGTGDPLFMAGIQEGFMRLSGDLTRLAARTESAELPGHARGTYVGLSNRVEFSALPDKDGASGAKSWPARMIIHDQQERVAFTADGLMTCNS